MQYLRFGSREYLGDFEEGRLMFYDYLDEHGQYHGVLYVTTVLPYFLAKHYIRALWGYIPVPFRLRKAYLGV